MIDRTLTVLVLAFMVVFAAGLFVAVALIAREFGR